jgi:hypothetical protein
MTHLAFESDVDAEELRPADYFDLMGGVGFGGCVPSQGPRRTLTLQP